MARDKGWLPRQHGAWAMLIAPLVIGLGIAPSHPSWVWPLVLAWLAGYLTFFAFGRWVKAPASRRKDLVKPLFAFGASSASAGGVMIALGGAPVLWWGLVFALPLSLALWQTVIGKERSILSGAAAVTASALIIPVLVFHTPGNFWSQSIHDPGVIFITLMVALYFIGTVVHVKANIRERGQLAARNRSVVWHATFLGFVLFLAALQLVSPWWILLFTLALGRTYWMTKPGSQYKPIQIGMLEMFLTLAVILISIFSR